MTETNRRATEGPPPAALSFDLFGTLVAVDAAVEPAVAIADELAARDVPVPADWRAAYAGQYHDLAPGAELSLSAHVLAALESRGVAVDEPETVREAVFAAFEGPVRTREDAVESVATLAAEYPVGILSNCTVPGLVESTIAESALDADCFGAVVASVECGWRKPDGRAFEACATRLGVPTPSLVHVGDDPGADGAGPVRSVLVDDVSLGELPALVEGWC